MSKRKNLSLGLAPDHVVYDEPVPEPVAEREPAERKVMHFKGNNVDELHKRYYFGPTHDPHGGPGRVWKIRHAEYDEATDTTTARLAPVAEWELNAVLRAIHQGMNNG